MAYSQVLSNVKLQERGKQLALVDTERSARELHEILKRTEDYVASTKGFRWQSPGHLKNQDRTLREYRRLATLVASLRGWNVQLDIDMLEDANDVIIFPSENETQVELVCTYLKLVSEEIKSTRSPDGRPRVSSLISRRQHMLYWIARLRAPNAPAFDRAKLLYRTKEIMEKLGRDNVFNTKPYQRLYLGKEDCLYMIEQDTIAAYASNQSTLLYASQHHLIWCFGLLCGIRPGSLVNSKDREGQYLQWEDVEIVRCFTDGKPNGRLLAQITFHWLKGNRDEVKKLVQRLKLTFRSPSDSLNLSLSIPHRIIVLALQRGILRDHRSVESVLSGSERLIEIKPEALRTPIFTKACDVSKEVDVAPMTYSALAGKISKVTMENGFPAGCTFYGFRAKVATNVERAQGLDTAQKVINHAVGSRTYYKHYDMGLENFDLTGMLLEGSSGAFETDSASLGTHIAPVLLRVDTEIESNDDRDAITMFLDEHPDLRKLKDTPGQKLAYRNKRKCLRLAAKRALLANRFQEQSVKLSGAEVHRRRQEILGGKLQDLIDRISGKAAEDAEARIPTNAIVDPEDLVDGDSREDATAVVDVDLNEEIASDATAIPPLLVQNWMEMLVNTVTSAPLPYDDLTTRAKEYSSVFGSRYSKQCQLCASDDTVSNADKSKTYATATALSWHVSSFFHTPFAKFTRSAQHVLDCGEQLICPYGCNKAFEDPYSLTAHITNDSKEDRSSEHEMRRQADGWDSTHFYEYASGVEQSKQKTKKRKMEAAFGQTPTKPKEAPKMYNQPSLLSTTPLPYLMGDESSTCNALNRFGSLLRGKPEEQTPGRLGLR